MQPGILRLRVPVVVEDRSLPRLASPPPGRRGASPEPLWPGGRCPAGRSGPLTGLGPTRRRGAGVGEVRQRDGCTVVPLPTSLSISTVAAELGHGLAHEDEAQGVELPVEALLVRQELLDLLPGHARAVVAHAEDDVVAVDHVADVDHAHLAPLHSVHRVHDQVEEHPAEPVALASQDGRVQLVEPQLHPGRAPLHHVAVDHVAGEVLEVLRDVELLVDVLAVLLGQEVLEAVVDARRSSGGSCDSARESALDRDSSGRKDRTPSIRPQSGFRISSQMSWQAWTYWRPAARTVLSGEKFLTAFEYSSKRLADVPRLLLELLQVVAVEGLGLVDVVDLEVGVEGDVVVDHLVEEPLAPAGRGSGT